MLRLLTEGEEGRETPPPSAPSAGMLSTISKQLPCASLANLRSEEPRGKNDRAPGCGSLDVRGLSQGLCRWCG